EFPQIEGSLNRRADEKGAVAGMNQEPLEILNAPFVAEIAGAEEYVGDPTLVGQVLGGKSFVELLAGDGDPAVLVLGQAKDSIQADGQGFALVHWAGGALRHGRLRGWFRRGRL